MTGLGITVYAVHLSVPGALPLNRDRGSLLDTAGRKGTLSVAGGARAGCGRGSWGWVERVGGEVGGVGRAGSPPRGGVVGTGPA